MRTMDFKSTKPFKGDAGNHDKGLGKRFCHLKVIQVTMARGWANVL